MDNRRMMQSLWLLVFVLNLVMGIGGVAGQMQEWQIALHAFLAILALLVVLRYRKKK